MICDHYFMFATRWFFFTNINPTGFIIFYFIGIIFLYINSYNIIYDGLFNCILLNKSFLKLHLSRVRYTSSDSKQLTSTESGVNNIESPISVSSSGPSVSTTSGMNKEELVEHIHNLTEVATNTTIGIGIGATVSLDTDMPTSLSKAGTLAMGGVSTTLAAGAIKMIGTVTANSIANSPDSLGNNSRPPSPSDFNPSSKSLQALRPFREYIGRISFHSERRS